eukprot:Lithocolla_globosa_v1_NODE_1119_length_2856_cov_5.298465.p1 type:complete len:626 gc:universal NODE_1119_length_2856_cov_5.298465:349-2226(+)
MLIYGKDDAPLWKSLSMCVGSLSVGNLGDLVRSIYHIYPWLMTDGKGSHSSVIKVCKKFYKSLENVRNTEYTVTNCLTGEDIKVRVEIQPSDDQLEAAFDSGELPPGSSTLLSPFGNVTRDNIWTHNGTIGLASDTTATWSMPPSYEQRLEQVKQVKIKKASLAEKIVTLLYLRQLLTKWMGLVGIRQEHDPIRGKEVEKNNPEILHIEKLAWIHFIQILYDIAKDNSDACVVRLYKALLALNLSAGGSMKTHHESSDSHKTFKNNLAGGESSTIAQNVPKLCNALLGNGFVDENRLKLVRLALYAVGLGIRDVASILNKIGLKESDLEYMERRAKCTWNICCTFLSDKNFAGAMWNFLVAAVFYCRLFFNRHGVGSGLLTLQGRESVHSFIKRLMREHSHKRSADDSDFITTEKLNDSDRKSFGSLKLPGKWGPIMYAFLCMNFILAKHRPDLSVKSGQFIPRVPARCKESGICACGEPILTTSDPVETDNDNSSGHEELFNKGESSGDINQVDELLRSEPTGDINYNLRVERNEAEVEDEEVEVELGESEVVREDKLKEKCATCVLIAELIVPVGNTNKFDKESLEMWLEVGCTVSGCESRFQTEQERLSHVEVVHQSISSRQ